MTAQPRPIFPPRLHPGDRLSIVAPSRSLSIIGPPVRAAADRRLRSLGYSLSLGAHVEEGDDFASTTVEHRVADFHAAWSDPGTRGLLTVIGGFNSNQMLRSLDYGTIERHPKVFCGYSDITALLVAVWARTGLVTYYGPHYSTFGDEKGADYTVDRFTEAVTSSDPFEVMPSPAWSEDLWWSMPPTRNFAPNPGPTILQPGEAEGTLVGGNLCTLNLLQGTGFLPDLTGALLFVEDEGKDGTPVYFDRNLQSLLHQPGGDALAGLLIGRIPTGAGMTPALLTTIVASKPELRGRPVVAGLDFGHTTPMMTIPIGGRARVQAAKAPARLTILAH